MGIAPKQSVETLRALITSAATTTLDPDVSDALAALKAAITRASGTPQTLPVTLTLIAATCGTAMTAPGMETEAENTQLAIIRSIYATHVAKSRVLH